MILMAYLLLCVLNVFIPYYIPCWIDKPVSRVFHAPQRLKPEEAFWTLLSQLLSAAQLAVRHCALPLDRSTCQETSLKREREKKNGVKRVNVNVCSRGSDPWRCVKTGARTKPMTTPSARPPPWREKQDMLSFKSCSLDSVNDSVRLLVKSWGSTGQAASCLLGLWLVCVCGNLVNFFVCFFLQYT